MSVSSPVPKDAPVMIAWEEWKKSDDFANSRKWAAQEAHVEGSLWNAFQTGFGAALGAERKRCLAIVQAARNDEIDGDFRAIKSMIESGWPIEKITSKD